MSEIRFLRAALRYAAHGLAVVPTRKGTKKPHSDDNGNRKVLTEPDDIRRWWGQWPDAEISLACGEVSGFDALDVDKQHGGFDSLHEYEKKHGPIPRAAYQRTPSGGFHVLFRHQAGLKNWCGGQKTAPAGLDRRGDGALIKAAPTDGYRWECLVKPSELPPWPSALADLYRPAERPPAPPRKRSPLIGDHADRADRYVKAVIQDYAERIGKLQPGCQRDELNALAFLAGKFLAAAPNVSSEVACGDLIAAGLTMANESGRDGWQHHQITKLVNDAVSDGVRDGPADLPDFSRPSRRTYRRR